MGKGALHQTKNKAIKKDSHRKTHTYPLSILWADALSDFKKLAKAPSKGLLNACYDLAHSLFQVLVFLKNETAHISESLRKQLLFYLSQIFGNIAQGYKDKKDKQITLDLQQEVRKAIESSDVLYYLPEACGTAHNIKGLEITQRVKNVGHALAALSPVVGYLDSTSETNFDCLKGIHADEHLANLTNMANESNVFNANLGEFEANGQSIQYPNVYLGDINYTSDTTLAIQATLGATRDAIARTLRNLEKGKSHAEKLFLVVRPPSHHAHHEHPEGFCFASTLAYAASILMRQRKKVLIVDFDVHHGNGTYQQLKRLHGDWLEEYYHFIDVFTKESYIENVPDEAEPEYKENMNFYPMRRGYTGADVLKKIKQGIDAMKARVVFIPDVILVSAGFDSVKEDNFGGLLASEDYGAIGELLASTCPNMVSFLEGGYDLEKLPESVTSYVVGTGGLAHQPDPKQVVEAVTFLYKKIQQSAIPANEAHRANGIVKKINDKIN